MDSGTPDHEAVGRATQDFDRAALNAELIVPEDVRAAVVLLRVTGLAAQNSYLENVYASMRGGSGQRDGLELIESFVTAKQLAEATRDRLLSAARAHFGLARE